MYSKWTEQKYLLSKCSSSKLLTKVFHILKVCHFKTHVVHIEPWNPKFVSAKKSVGKTEKGRNQENLQRVAGWQDQIWKGVNARDRVEYCWICECGGLEKN